jgi:hypothetical protein
MFVLVLAILVMGSCNVPEKKNATEQKKDNVLRSYDKSKRLVSEIPVKDGKRHGLAKTYYKTGKVNMEMNYMEDKREGLSKRYYETGLLFQETQYHDDQIHGFQKKYDAKGLISEARFEHGKPCTGLKEFFSGKQRTDYPVIQISVSDRIQIDGTYTLFLSVTEGASKVEFYVGELTKGGCVSMGMIPLAIGPSKNTGKMKYTLSPGQFIMDDLKFVAVITTRSGNTWLASKTFPLSIEN